MFIDHSCFKHFLNSNSFNADDPRRWVWPLSPSDPGGNWKPRWFWAELSFGPGSQALESTLNMFYVMGLLKRGWYCPQTRQRLGPHTAKWKHVKHWNILLCSQFFFFLLYFNRFALLKLLQESTSGSDMNLMLYHLLFNGFFYLNSWEFWNQQTMHLKADSEIWQFWTQIPT